MILILLDPITDIALAGFKDYGVFIFAGLLFGRWRIERWNRAWAKG